VVGTDEPTRVHSGAILIVALLLVVVFIAGLFVLMGTTTFDTWGAMLIVPVLLLVSMPILVRQANREGDRRVLWLLVIAFFLKMAGSVVRYYVAFDVYGGVADASLYDEVGRKVAGNIWNGDFFPAFGDDGFTSIEFMEFLTGIVYSVIGPSRMGGFLVYSWLGFWGLFLFYRAYTIAVPEGRRLTYGRLLFFLPSLLFWPSSIGKESWMMFTLGIAAFGAARILSGKAARGVPWMVLGLWLAAFVRPHVAGLIAVSMAGAYLFRRPREELQQLAPVVKGIGVVVVGIIALVAVVKADEFLRSQGVDTSRGVTSALTDVSYRTGSGGSSYQPSILQSPARAPIALVTVLYRPFLFEAHNTQAVFAALETTFLLFFSIVRFPWVLAALRSIRRQPYVAFAFLYTGVFVLAFSSFANFGLLARERVQLFPLYLVLFTIPPPEKHQEAEEWTSEKASGTRVPA
jgi:hypothetical protein